MRESTEQKKAKEQLSEEELQRTQVLNLADFKEVARIEKITSKRPAIIVAVLGFVSISLGTIFPAVQSLQARRENENKSVVEARRETNLKAKQEKMSCKFVAEKVADGTDQTLEFKFTFENKELVKLTKEFTMVETPGSKIGTERVKVFASALTPFLVQKSGYKTSVINKEKGLTAKIDIDYDLLDMTQIPDLNKGNYIYTIDYPAKANKDVVKAEMEAKKFICE